MPSGSELSPTEKRKRDFSQLFPSRRHLGLAQLPQTVSDDHEVLRELFIRFLAMHSLKRT
jgi:hypothetical protein